MQADMWGQVVNELLRRKERALRLLVGIDGLSGAGKTTIVEKIQKELQDRSLHVSVIHMDDHIRVRSDRYDTGRASWEEHYFLQWDVAGLAECLFKRVRENCHELRLPFYDSSTDSVSERDVVVPEKGIILVEGVFLQRVEWQSFFDFVIYLDCPRKTRFERVSRRSNQDVTNLARLETYRRRYWAAEDYYLKTEQPLLHANFVLDMK
jgi:uridine kinase